MYATQVKYTLLTLGMTVAGLGFSSFFSADPGADGGYGDEVLFVVVEPSPAADEGRSLLLPPLRPLSRLLLLLLPEEDFSPLLLEPDRSLSFLSLLSLSFEDDLEEEDEDEEGRL